MIYSFYYILVADYFTVMDNKRYAGHFVSGMAAGGLIGGGLLTAMTSLAGPIVAALVTPAADPTRFSGVDDGDGLDLDHEIGPGETGDADRRTGRGRHPEIAHADVGALLQLVANYEVRAPLRRPT